MSNKSLYDLIKLKIINVPEPAKIIPFDIING